MINRLNKHNAQQERKYHAHIERAMINRPNKRNAQQERKYHAHIKRAMIISTVDTPP